MHIPLQSRERNGRNDISTCLANTNVKPHAPNQQPDEAGEPERERRYFDEEESDFAPGIGGQQSIFEHGEGQRGEDGPGGGEEEEIDCGRWEVQFGDHFWNLLAGVFLFLPFFFTFVGEKREGRTVDTVAEDNDSDGRLDDAAGEVDDVWYCHSWDVRDLVLM